MPYLLDFVSFLENCAASAATNAGKSLVSAQENYTNGRLQSFALSTYFQRRLDIGCLFPPLTNVQQTKKIGRESDVL